MVNVVFWFLRNAIGAAWRLFVVMGKLPLTCFGIRTSPTNWEITVISGPVSNPETLSCSNDIISNSKATKCLSQISPKCLNSPPNFHQWASEHCLFTPNILLAAANRSALCKAPHESPTSHMPAIIPDADKFFLHFELGKNFSAKWC